VSELDALVIGAGLAGLATGAALRAHGVPRFAVVEQGADVGHFWSTTYDRLHLHSPWHDLPYDGGASRRYPMYKSKHDMARYFREYAKRHELDSHLRLGERVLRVRRRGGDAGDGDGWSIETTRGEHSARYLVVATAINRSPHEPAIPARQAYRGAALHSVQYRNPTPFRGQRVLVVGSGNSAAEIALDLVQGGAAAVAMWVRGPRWFIPLRRMSLIYRLFRLLGQASPAKMDVRHRITFGTPEFERALAPIDALGRRLAVDLSAFGIRQPELGPQRESFARGRIPTYDVGAVEEIRRGRIRVIDGNRRPIEGFTESGVRFADGDEPFDAVVLATGFRPKLEEFLAEPAMLGPVRWLEAAPLTDGRCRSVVYPTAFFPGFDPTPIGGLSLGRWGWEVGSTIAREIGRA
jgi:indole-3-pyruvate monooxygenase